MNNINISYFNDNDKFAKFGIRVTFNNEVKIMKFSTEIGRDNIFNQLLNMLGINQRVINYKEVD